MVEGSLGKIDGGKLADEVRGLFGGDNRTQGTASPPHSPWLGPTQRADWEAAQNQQGLR